MKKKNLFLAAALALSSAAAHADEGMWTLYNLPQAVYEQMKSYGFTPSYDQLYKSEDAIKNAVVNFSGYCSGVVVSPDGLVFTNHHCGFEAIRSHSTVEHDYMLNGFYAKTFEEELPNKDMFVSFMVDQKDITEMLAQRGFNEMNNEQREKLLNEVENQMIKELHEQDPSLDLEIKPFYEGNKYYATTYRTFRDLRLVFTIPKSMGKFGGETDNWMWPRHTCDFSMFRVYANKDNEPADYSEDNVPMTPKQSLKISLKGVNEGDYAMVMGYPGRTQRFQTASMLEQMIRKQDVSIAARTLRQSIMKEGMEADPAVRLQYANKYAGSSNGWKKWIGEKKAFEKLNIIGREEQKEADFMKWVNANKKRKAAYGSALTDIKSVIDETSADELAFRLILEAPLNIGMCNLIGDYAQTLMLKFKAHPEDTAAAFVAAKEAMKGAFKDYYEPLERKLTAGLLKFYRDNARPSDYPEIEGHDFATMDIDAYVSDLYDHSIFASDEKMQNSDIKSFPEFRNDPALALYNAIIAKYSPLYKSLKAANVKLSAGSKAFEAGLL